MKFNIIIAKERKKILYNMIFYFLFESFLLRTLIQNTRHQFFHCLIQIWCVFNNSIIITLRRDTKIFILINFQNKHYIQSPGKPFKNWVWKWIPLNFNTHISQVKELKTVDQLPFSLSLISVIMMPRVCASRQPCH